MTPLDRLKAMARSWGGEIRRVPPPPGHFFSIPPDSGLSLCPFEGGLAVEHARLRVVFWNEYPDLGALVHEMGHVFAARKVPARAREWRFFGWEYLVARRGGCSVEWFKSSGDYVIGGGGRAFGGLSPSAQRKILASRIRFARRNGLIKGGVPVSIRRRRTKP